MFNRYFIFGLFICTFTSNLWAEKIPYPDLFSSAPIKRFQPTENPLFGSMDRELKNTISRLGDPSMNNIFCASGFIFPDGLARAMVIWSNQNLLYWWEGSEDVPGIERPLTLWQSPYSDLSHAVDDGVMLSGPTTVNKSQAQSAIGDCEQYGQKFLIRPFTPFIQINGQELDFDEKDLEFIEESDGR